VCAVKVDREKQAICVDELIEVSRYKALVKKKRKKRKENGRRKR